MELTGDFEEIGWVNGKLYTFIVKSVKENKDAELTSVHGYHSTHKSNADVSAVHGYHSTHKSNADVSAVQFENTDLKNFPKGLNKFFLNLISLEIKKCNLTAVTKSDLVGLEGLECLHLGSNLIESLPNGLLVGMSELLYVYFPENRLTHLGAQFLDPLDVTRCELVDFRDNTSISENFDKRKHGSIDALKKLIDEKCEPAVEKKSKTVVPDMMRRLLASGSWSDFTIKVDKDEIKVHKNVLAASSAAFSKMFEHNFEETLTNVMTFHDHTAGAVKDFIRFIYTGEIETAENAMELFDLAALYHVPELKDLCEEMVLENLSEANLVEVFNMAELHSSNLLKIAAIKKIVDSFPGKNLDVDMLSEPAEFHGLVFAKRRLDFLLNKLEK